MCVSNSKTSDKECKVDELKNSVIEDKYNSTNRTHKESDGKKESESTNFSPQLRINKPKFTKSKVPLIVINQESKEENTEKDSSRIHFQNSINLKNKHSMSTDTVENNLMMTFTKSSVKSPPEFDLQDRKLENVEKNVLLPSNTFKEEVVIMNYYN
jgi:Trm5-related predicted tRNA methylase